MEVIKALNKFTMRRSIINASCIGFVPTMGNLHNGHLSLIEKSLSNHETTIVSIFVNPKQFGPNEDFDKYPRTLESDCDKIKELSEKFPKKEIIVFSPGSVNEIYPSGFDTTVSVGRLTKILCGESRPTHFDGVTTIVHQLFQIVKPSKAYFGLKDYQQFKVISKMVNDLLIPVELEGMPIIRDEDGLALSSRNQFLSIEERKQALYLPRTLNDLASTLKKDGLQAANQLVNEKINEKNWDYLTILNSETLEPASKSNQKLVVLGAIKIGKTRLIDNILV